MQKSPKFEVFSTRGARKRARTSFRAQRRAFLRSGPWLQAATALASGTSSPRRAHALACADPASRRAHASACAGGIDQTRVDRSAREQSFGGLAVEVELDLVFVSRAARLELEQRHSTRRVTNRTVDRSTQHDAVQPHRERHLMEPVPRQIDRSDVRPAA